MARPYHNINIRLTEAVPEFTQDILYTSRYVLPQPNPVPSTTGYYRWYGSPICCPIQTQPANHTSNLDSTYQNRTTNLSLQLLDVYNYSQSF